MSAGTHPGSFNVVLADAPPLPGSRCTGEISRRSGKSRRAWMVAKFFFIHEAGLTGNQHNDSLVNLPVEQPGRSSENRAPSHDLHRLMIFGELCS